MKTIKIPVKVITFIHKDTGETHSVVGGMDVTSDAFEEAVFGVDYNVTGLYKAMSHAEKLGHKVVSVDATLDIIL